VVAVNQWTAQHAAKRVKVEYKGLEPVIITLEVKKESSTLFVFQKWLQDTLKLCPLCFPTYTDISATKTDVNTSKPS